ncbi:hypothetical protein PSQ20_20595 [Curvibacter sp. RS43]|uniref:helix-turn-helix transcriptional regulator n=1 Tax=Curvibacter microcysteis TaxID=3026419 RepID=UPI002360A3AB|nr:hypothetical protein [Curvibacter sp. RS43]MDD0812754.1 hypothetical protein [Curvibacter sp. RS43]
MPRQNTKHEDYPQAVIKQIELLGQYIVIARKRRRETQAQWAEKLGVSQPTMARIERGDPSVAMATYVMCIWLINPRAGLADLIAPLNDHAALESEVTRIRPRRGAVKAAESPEPAVDSAKTNATSVLAAASRGMADLLGRRSEAEIVALIQQSPALKAEAVLDPQLSSALAGPNHGRTAVASKDPRHPAAGTPPSPTPTPTGRRLP